jgi:hypothetical protein
VIDCQADQSERSPVDRMDDRARTQMVDPLGAAGVSIASTPKPSCSGPNAVPSPTGSVSLTAYSHSTIAPKSSRSVSFVTVAVATVSGCRRWPRA